MSAIPVRVFKMHPLFWRFETLIPLSTTPFFFLSFSFFHRGAQEFLDTWCFFLCFGGETVLWSCYCFPIPPPSNLRSIFVVVEILVLSTTSCAGAGAMLLGRTVHSESSIPNRPFRITHSELDSVHQTEGLHISKQKGGQISPTISSLSSQDLNWNQEAGLHRCQ